MQRCNFDVEYVRKLANEDPETEEHFSRYFGELLSIKLGPRLRSAAAVEDVRQETFVRVLSLIRHKGIERPEALGGLVNSVCNNVLFETYRSQTREAPPPDERASHEPSAEASLLSEEERGLVRTVLGELPTKEQRILRRLFFEDASKDDICREFDVDREYLRVLLHRAKARFRMQFLKISAGSSAEIETERTRASQKG